MRIGDAAASAMNAFGVEMMVRANNIANVNTAGFTPAHVTLADGPQGRGVAVGSICPDMSPGPLVPGYDRAVNGTGYVAGSNTDMAREFAYMTGDQQAYAANAVVIRVHDRMAGSLLDVIA